MAAAIYLVIGLLIASLLFNVLGYSSSLRGQHNASVLRPVFNQIFKLVYASHIPWFPPQQPAIYTYDLLK